MVELGIEKDQSLLRVLLFEEGGLKCYLSVAHFIRISFQVFNERVLNIIICYNLYILYNISISFIKVRKE